MSAKILDGEVLAAKMKTEISAQVANLKSTGKSVLLNAVQVGENAASRVYVKNQKKACEEVGITYELKELPAETTQDELLSFIDGLNADPKVTGIILQMPLPEGVDSRTVQRKIAPEKDVEGMHPANMGQLVFGDITVAPCTPLGAMELLKANGIDIKGKEAVVVGHSEIVGKPLALMLLSSMNESATPTVCHIATKDLKAHTLRADLLFVACGVPGLIKGDMIKEGAIVVDIGINRVPDIDKDGNPVLNKKGKPKKKTVGDVIFEEAVEKASYIAPVPGGVGPLTVCMLLRNTAALAEAAG
jgi:methylenetetrahydrofolate dehydrogenase (NADP+)/methenyltetrahydrofolate cyclohydrolase